MKSHGTRSWEYGGKATQLLFLSSITPQLLRRYERGHCHVEIIGGASFLIILFSVSSVVLSCDVFAPFHRHF